MVPGAHETKSKALRAFKLLVLSFWIGGGLVAGVIARLSVRNYFGPTQKDEADKVMGGILFWFSITEIIAGAVLLAVLFFVERARRGVLIALGAIVLITVVNEFIVSNWMQTLQADNATRETLQNVYLSLFFAGMAIALGLFLVTALEKDPGRAAAAPAPDRRLPQASGAPSTPPPVVGPAPFSSAPPAPSPAAPSPPQPGPRQGGPPGGAARPAAPAGPGGPAGVAGP